MEQQNFEIILLESILAVNEDINIALNNCFTDTERLYLKGKKDTLKKLISKLYINI